MTVARERTVRRPVHGVLLLDKPLGLTSNQALQRAKRLYRAEKAGHTGTLDPLATGLLPLCFGAATKFSQASLDADKAYRATLQLGERTASGDRETPVTERRPVDIDAATLDAVLQRFAGRITQLPPMHSALKKDGRALYDYARAGEQVERTPRPVCIHRLEVVAFAGPQLTLDVACSKGTYIRTLADDIGEALGCGAHLAALQRTASGPLRLSEAIGLDALEALPEPQRDALLRPADSLLAAWPELQLAADEAARFLTGLRRRVAAADAPAVRVYAEQPRAFLGSGHVAAGELIADRLLSPAEVQACTTTHEV
jgi:tRNA pseudouridine55 synthase